MAAAKRARQRRTVASLLRELRLLKAENATLRMQSLGYQEMARLERAEAEERVRNIVERQREQAEKRKAKDRLRKRARKAGVTAPRPEKKRGTPWTQTDERILETIVDPYDDLLRTMKPVDACFAVARQVGGTYLAVCSKLQRMDEKGMGLVEKLPPAKWRPRER